MALVETLEVDFPPSAAWPFSGIRLARGAA